MAEAKRLIEEAGANGREVRLMAASDSWHPKAAQIIVQNLTDIGLKVVTASSTRPPTSTGSSTRRTRTTT